MNTHREEGEQAKKQTNTHVHKYTNTQTDLAHKNKFTHCPTKEALLECDSEHSLFHQCNEGPAGAKCSPIPRQNQLKVFKLWHTTGAFTPPGRYPAAPADKHTDTQNMSCQQIIMCKSFFNHTCGIFFMC